jgi:hypothetical protein
MPCACATNWSAQSPTRKGRNLERYLVMGTRSLKAALRPPIPPNPHESFIVPTYRPITRNSANLLRPNLARRVFYGSSKIPHRRSTDITRRGFFIASPTSLISFPSNGARTCPARLQSLLPECCATGHLVGHGRILRYVDDASTRSHSHIPFQSLQDGQS